MVSLPEVTTAVREDFDFPKIELHLHLDGAIRYETILELAKEKEIDLKGAQTVEELKNVVVTHEPASLAKVLEAFNIFLPVVTGDKEAIERIAYELCEDQYDNGVVYFEARYSPHFLCNTVPHHVANGNGVEEKLCPRGVVEAVKRGLDRGEKKFGVKARSILCCIRGFEDWNNEILELATSMKDYGVVGIDVAGCAHGADEQYEESVVRVFQEAARRGIHRTVHAGESGTAKEVCIAIDRMKAQRIGHGYRLIWDEAAYKKHAVEEQTHLEGCPYSSVMTGSVVLDWANHPITHWVKDGVNFSLSTDDPTCFDNCMLSELQLTKECIGLTTHQIWKCQLNAARACFLPDEDKKLLIEQVLNAEPKED
uniref:Adenosine deaminase n=1 Tax=Steinernema glaseri TaxID=37863 RepID=A0A1I7XYQ0_9BILA